jgi:hypothetical protein
MHAWQIADTRLLLLRVGGCKLLSQRSPCGCGLLCCWQGLQLCSALQTAGVGHARKHGSLQCRSLLGVKTHDSQTCARVHDLLSASSRLSANVQFCATSSQLLALVCCQPYAALWMPGSADLDSNCWVMFRCRHLCRHCHSRNATFLLSASRYFSPCFTKLMTHLAGMLSKVCEVHLTWHLVHVSLKSLDSYMCCLLLHM